jgi:hypothetical protein
MSPNIKKSIPPEAHALAPEAEAHACFAHLHAFNFGRSVQRMENPRHAFWVRVRWLLWGAAVGVSLTAVYLQMFASSAIGQIAMGESPKVIAPATS